MVISMKSDCDAEIPLENFFTGKWHIDDSCLIPATELHNPIFPKSRKNETVKDSSNRIKGFGVQNERIVTSSKTLIKSSDCNDNLKTKSENRRRIEQENVRPEIKSNSLELPLKRRGKPQKTKIKKIRTSGSSMQCDDDDGSNNVFEIPTQTDKERARPRKDDNRNPNIKPSSSCFSFENEDITKNKVNTEKRMSSDSNLNLIEDPGSSFVRKDGMPNMKEITKNSEHVNPKKGTEFLDLNVKKRGRPRKNGVEKDHIQADSSSSSENIRKNSGDSIDSSVSLVRKAGRPKKSERASNSEHINSNKGLHSPSPDSLNVKKRGRPRKNSVEKDHIQSDSNSSFENIRKNSGDSADSPVSLVRKVGRPKKSERASNSEHINSNKGLRSPSPSSLNVKKRGTPRKNSVEKDHIQSDNNSSFENIRKISGDSADSPVSLVRKVGRPKKSERASNSEHINSNKGLHSPSPDSLNVKKRGRPRKNSVEKDHIQPDSSNSSDNIRKNSGDSADSPVLLVRKVGRPKKSERAKNSEHINPNKGSHSLSPSVKRRGRPQKDASKRAHIQPCSSSSEKEQDTILPLELAVQPVKRRGRPKKGASKTESESQGIYSVVKSSGFTSESSVSPVKIGRSTKKRKENKPQINQDKGNFEGTFSRAGRPISITKYTSDESDVFESDDEWREQCVKKVNARQFENYSKNKPQKEMKKKGKKTKGCMDAKTQSKQAVGINSDNTVNQHTQQEPLKPEDCHVTAKRGTLKYLHQREKFVDAVMKETQVEDDFFSSIIPDRVPGKKNVLSNLLASSSPDDSLTIKTPQGKGKLINSNIITPRTMKLGEWANGSPWCDTVTPSTTSSAPESEKKEALEVIYHFMRGRKRRTQPLRKVLSDRSSLSQSADVLPTQTQLIQLPALPDIPEDRCSDSSEDDYFNSSNAP